MFNYPATELFNVAGERRVAWSLEEYESALADGWSEERPAATDRPDPVLPAAPAAAPRPRAAAAPKPKP